MNSMLSRRRALRSSGLMLAALGVSSTGIGLLLRPAFAQEARLTFNDQTAVAVTIYNENLALVKDRRNASLVQGLNNIAFIDVSGQMRPETALLHAEGEKLTLLEQNFEFDLLTHEKLLEKSVGQTVTVIKTNPATGAETVEEARGAQRRRRPGAADRRPHRDAVSRAAWCSTAFRRNCGRGRPWC